MFEELLHDGLECFMPMRFACDLLNIDLCVIFLKILLVDVVECFVGMCLVDGDGNQCADTVVDCEAVPERFAVVLLY